MIGFMSGTAPVEPEDLKVFRNLLAMITDPNATRDRLEHLAAASAELNAATAAANVAKAELVVAETTSREAMQAARAEHDAAITKAQTDFDAACQRREVALTAREHRLAEVEAKAAADAQAHAALKADLERRFDLFKQATAA
jgi:hypothetical protein